MKIALVQNDDFSMWHFRKSLILELLARKMQVYLIVPPGEYVEKLRGLGATTLVIPMGRFISPLRDILLFFRFYKLCRKEHFDIVHTMTIKPNIFVAMAAKMAGCRNIVGLVSGSGYVFSESTSKAKAVLRFLVVHLYGFSLRRINKVWFQNDSDKQLFIKNGMVEEGKCVVIRGSGINTQEYSLDSVQKSDIASVRRELNINPGSKCIVMITARMIWSKGVREFVEAAILFKERFPEWVFVMLCPRDAGTPDSVPVEYIEQNRSPNLIVLDKFRKDIRAILAMSHIVVLPSYYPEGVPRVLLEGLALSKPIVTTHCPGCKEVVEEGVNGYLVPPRDACALAEALKKLMDDEHLLNSCAAHSRTMAVEQFDDKVVIKRVFDELYLLNHAVF